MVVAVFCRAPGNSQCSANVYSAQPRFQLVMLILWPNPLVFAVGWVAGVCAWAAIMRDHDRNIVTYTAATVAVLITLLAGAVVGLA